MYFKRNFPRNPNFLPVLTRDIPESRHFVFFVKILSNFFKNSPTKIHATNFFETCFKVFLRTYIFRKICFTCGPGPSKKFYSLFYFNFWHFFFSKTYFSELMWFMLAFIRQSNISIGFSTKFYIKNTTLECEK